MQMKIYQNNLRKPSPINYDYNNRNTYGMQQRQEMASYSAGDHQYSPSAPPAPDPDQPKLAYPYHPPQTPTNPYAHITYPSSSASGSIPPPYGFGNYPYQQQQNIYSSFPPGTHPDVIRSFQMADRNQKGYIEEKDLQQALAWNYQKFSLRTLRFLTFLFRNRGESSFLIGPKEFTEVWSCLSHWRVIFERFDRDRSGKIDTAELRDALYSLGFALPPSVLQLLISRYDDDSGRRAELNFDSFVESAMIVKGLTEKFKEKDPRYTGSATLTYDTFMSMLVPFLVSD